MTLDTARTVMLLNELAELLEGYADADGIPSGGGYHPNRAMVLLREVEEEIARLGATRSAEG
jgi:hypothetical protein